MNVKKYQRQILQALYLGNMMIQMRCKTLNKLTIKNLIFTGDMSGKSFEQSASKWMPNDLLRLGISFNNEEMDMKDFLPKLKNPEVASIRLSKEHKLILKFTKDLWRFSFEFDTRTFKKTSRGKREKANNLANGKKCTNNALSNIEKHQLKHESGATNDYKRYLVLKNCIFFSVKIYFLILRFRHDMKQNFF